MKEQFGLYNPASMNMIQQLSVPEFALSWREFRDILPKHRLALFLTGTLMHAHILKNTLNCISRKQSSQIAISSRNKMIHHLYIKGIYIILIEFFYYYIHNRTADSEKHTKVKAQGVIYYFHSSEGDSFSQYIYKRNKIHMRNTSKYTSNCFCVSKTGITTEQSVLSALQVFF